MVSRQLYASHDKAHHYVGVWTFGPAFKEEQERRQQEKCASINLDTNIANIFAE